VLIAGRLGVELTEADFRSKEVDGSLDLRAFDELLDRLASQIEAKHGHRRGVLFEARSLALRVAMFVDGVAGNYYRLGRVEDGDIATEVGARFLSDVVELATKEAPQFVSEGRDLLIELEGIRDKERKDRTLAVTMHFARFDSWYIRLCATFYEGT
jgi:hypothetical protein